MGETCSQCQKSQKSDTLDLSNSNRLKSDQFIIVGQQSQLQNLRRDEKHLKATPESPGKEQEKQHTNTNTARDQKNNLHQSNHEEQRIDIQTDDNLNQKLTSSKVDFEKMNEPKDVYARIVSELPKMKDDVQKAYSRFREFQFDFHKYKDLLFIEKPMEILQSQDVYVGFWKLGQPHGSGRCFFQSGAIYEGEINNGKADGVGRYISFEGVVYEGDFKDNKPHGQCTMTSLDKKHYEGDWVNGQREGNGVDNNGPKGISYVGEFRSDMMSGKGEYIIQDQFKYVGEFKLNDIEGQGVCEWVNGKQYTGHWVQNKMHGYGVFTWPDGQKYTGDFIQDKFQGNGEFIWPNGIQFNGEWLNGEMNGQGELITEQNEKFIGVWKNGKRVTATHEQSPEKDKLNSTPVSNSKS